MREAGGGGGEGGGGGGGKGRGAAHFLVSGKRFLKNQSNEAENWQIILYHTAHIVSGLCMIDQI